MSLEATAGRGIDHLVLPVKDLGKARERYAALGFTLTPDAQHPFGSGNFLAQLQGSFLEVLSITRPELVPEAAPGHFSFAGYNRDFLTRREGFSMLVFESADARRDQAEFLSEGLQTYAPFDFERQAKLPSGESVTVGFSLAFVTEPGVPDAVFFTCQQHAPQYFWKPSYQKHPNSAQSVEEVVMVAPEPRALEGLFVGLQGRERVAAHADSLTIKTARGRISVQTPAGYEARFPGGTPQEAPLTPYFAAYAVGVSDIARCEAVLTESGLAFEREGRSLLLAPQDAFGTAIAFREI